MATNFPTSLDTLTNPTATDTLDSPPHDTQHADANDAIEAIQAKVGVDSSAVTTSLDYRVGQLELGGGSMTTSSTAPSSPSDGDMWYDTDDGRTYVYYDDGTSAQWVEFGAPAVAHGKILQVVSTTKTDRFSTTSTSYVDITGYSVSITPTSTSSKILVVPYLNSSITGDYVSYFQMMRGATAIMQGDIVGTAQQVSWANAMGLNWDYGIYSTTAVYLDSPNTTSATTYKVQCKVNNAAGTLKVNSDGVGGTSGVWFTTASSITVLEVSA